MVSPQWDEGDEAQKALRAIVSDPAYGIAALSSAQMMANLLKDLLPDAPCEVSVLTAAAEAGVAGHLRDRVSQGMDGAPPRRWRARSRPVPRSGRMPAAGR